MSNDEVLKFRLPAELKSEAQEWCAEQGVSVGAWLRKLMQESLPPRKRPVQLSDGTKLS